MKWFAELGFKVVGVEVCDLPIKSFFEDNSIAYTVEKNDFPSTCTFYKSIDESICIYNCDFFDFTPEAEGQFDFIWDRGGLSATEPDNRTKYIDLILTLMSPDSMYLLETFEYDSRHHPGPPYNLPVESVHELFGKYCKICRKDEKEFLENARIGFCQKLDYCRICFYAIQLK